MNGVQCSMFNSAAAYRSHIQNMSLVLELEKSESKIYLSSIENQVVLLMFNLFSNKADTMIAVNILDSLLYRDDCALLVLRICYLLLVRIREEIVKFTFYLK